MSQSTKRSADVAFDEVSRISRKQRKESKRASTSTKTNGSAATKPLSENLPTNSAALREKTSSKLKDSPKASKIQKTSSSSQKSKPRESKAHDKTQTHKEKKHKKERSEKGQLVLEMKPRSSNKPRVVQKSWFLSSSTGGTFIDHDPILTADGKYVILPTSNEIQIYSSSTSLLVRSLQIAETDIIVGCCVSASDADTVLVATRSGQVVKYNWTTGAKVARWHTNSTLHSITPVACGSSDEHFLAINSIKDGDEELRSYSTQPSSKKIESSLLLREATLQKLVIASPTGSIVIACGNKIVYLAEADSTDGKIQERTYTWHKLLVTGSITSFDVRFSSPDRKPNKNKTVVDVVVSHENGSIFIYQDILSKLIRHAKGGQKVDLSGRKLHWHRGHVRSVKWSRDGNYVVSGGDESVLVIWQLETNQQQFLPHLSTSVVNITVSALGAEYALRLGDNSVMVLSTADLLPSTNITGLSLANDRHGQTSMILHPTIPNRLLSAVPIRFLSDAKHSNATATHLQTFDIDANIQLNRQALTRNVTTTVNIAPDGQPLQEPHISHLNVSNDGRWLATVDRWSPNTKDTQALYLNEDDQLTKQALTETVLRFWSWDQDSDSWEVVTRIDTPHIPSKFSLLDLASNPSSQEFSTIGEDGWLKIWQPQRRIRDGVQVRDRSGKPLSTWVCARAIQIERSHIGAKSSVPRSGTLTYSEDGSVLAASWSDKQRQIHLIDVQTGKVCLSQPNLLSEGQSSILIAGRQLLCLSRQSFKIFDTITLQVGLTLSLNYNQSSLMAVNPRANTVAVALNQRSPDKRPSASISIFDLENLDKGSIKVFELNNPVRALLSEPTGRSFVVIDQDRRVRKILPPGNVTISQSTALVKASSELETFGTEIENIGKNLEDLFGRESGHNQRQKQQQQQQQKLIGDIDSSVSGSGSIPQNLADLFSSSTTTAGQLGIREMFERVSRAVAKPIPV